MFLLHFPWQERVGSVPGFCRAPWRHIGSSRLGSARPASRRHLGHSPGEMTLLTPKTVQTFVGGNVWLGKCVARLSDANFSEFYKNISPKKKSFFWGPFRFFTLCHLFFMTVNCIFPKFSLMCFTVIFPHIFL